MRILKEKRKTPCIDVKIQKWIKKYTHYFSQYHFMSTLEEDSTARPSLPSNTIFVFRDNLLLSPDSFHSGLISFIWTYQVNFYIKVFTLFVPSALSALPPKYLHGLVCSLTSFRISLWPSQLVLSRHLYLKCQSLHTRTFYPLPLYHSPLSDILQIFLLNYYFPLIKCNL